MKKIAIEINEKLFIAYVGLTASGYDLADKKDPELQKLTSQIRSAKIQNEVIEYFSATKTSQYSVNPYWPRGSCISSACFFINGKDEYNTFSDYLAFEKSIGADTEEDNDDFRNWIIRLPIFLKEIKNSESYPILRSEYQKILASRKKEYTAELRIVDKCVAKFNSNSINNSHIVFVPNLLQAYSIADFVLKDNIIFVIATHPDTITLLHEYLHPIVNKYKNILKNFVNKADFNVFADMRKMSSYGYMREDSIEAKIHTLEECAVRAMSIILSNDAHVKKQQYCK